MFKTAEKTELNQISLTGMRAIVLVGLLIVKPRSLNEIRNAFLDLKIIEESHSDDILRIDLNTLKVMGCEISRASAKTNHKYILTKHPFSFTIQEDEIAALKKVYKHIKQNADLTTLLDYHQFFEKIANHVYDKATKEALLGISALKYYEIGNLQELLSDCKHQRVLELAYHKPTSKSSSIKKVVAQELVLKNDKVYLYGYDLDKEESTILNLKRMKKIISRSFREEGLEPRITKIKFLYKP